MHAVQAWLAEDNQLVLAQSTASLTQCKACELGHYLLQPTAQTLYELAATRLGLTA